MPCAWVTYLLRIDTTIDAADRDLTDSERAMFMQELQRTIHQRRDRRTRFSWNHPRPSPAKDASP